MFSSRERVVAPVLLELLEVREQLELVDLLDPLDPLVGKVRCRS